MKAIQIIRIEHTDGIGMFTDFTDDYKERMQCVWNILPELSNRHKNFNTPEEDNLNLDKNFKDWYCAYKSIEQLQEWVLKDEFKTLFDYGYKVLLIECTNYQIGKDQVIYTKESIKTSKDISSLFL